MAPAQTAETRRKPDVPFVPTTDEAVQAMLKLAEVKSTDTVYDLGCGDGRIVIAAVKNFGARGVGIDIDPQRIKEARENAKKAGVENRVKFHGAGPLQGRLPRGHGGDVVPPATGESAS